MVRPEASPRPEPHERLRVAELDELLITSSCRISRPLGDAKVLRDYLRDRMHGRLWRRMEADAKSLFALYGYGRLHGFVRASSIGVSGRTRLDRSWMLNRQKEAS